MTYQIEFWGKEASTGKEFKEKLEAKSPKPKNWLPKMRKEFGHIYDFNSLSDFNYVAKPKGQ